VPKPNHHVEENNIKIFFKKSLNTSTIVLKNSHPLSKCMLAAGGSLEVYKIKKN
jgi:hypothetical protein